MYTIYFLNPKTKIKAHKWITTYVCVCSVGTRMFGSTRVCAYSEA